MPNTCESLDGLKGMLCSVLSLLNYVIPVLIAVGVVYFVWGVVQYVISDSEEVKTKGKNSMIYGLIGLAVIVAMWGLVNVVLGTFNLNNSGDSNNMAPTNDQIRGLLPQ